MRRLMVVFFILIGLTVPISSIRADGITIASINLRYTFARSMTATLSASSDAPITQATFFYQAGSGQPIGQASSPFEPARQVDLTATVDLSSSHLPAFSTISYWWEVTDAAGRQLKSEALTLAYVDNRFDWREIAAKSIRVHWYQGEASFSAAAASVANDALPRIQQQLGVEAPSPIDIYIYASLSDLRSAVELAGRQWLGGQARPELGVVMVAIPPGPEATIQMRRDIPHELTHLMVFIATTPGYRSVPAWLDEGLATLNEEEPDPTQAVALQDALAANRLIPLETLCGPFSTDATTALLSYAESRSIVQQIIDAYGSAGLQALLAAYRDGATCEGGVKRGLSVTLAGVESKWRASLGTGGSAAAVTEGAGPWLLLWLMIALPLLGLFTWRKQ